jgi:hypothetical protein
VKQNGENKFQNPSIHPAGKKKKNIFHTRDVTNHPADKIDVKL